MTKDEAQKKIGELVERFCEQIDSYKKSDYNETLTRRDFIDPFFKALGWDIINDRWCRTIWNFYSICLFMVFERQKN